ncbi:MAG: hypothetical protein OK449_03815 [Thaumarchaeota archaeon]|nr:hypothetical protein [Nitrososphaerota archaeon]
MKTGSVLALALLAVLLAGAGPSLAGAHPTQPPTPVFKETPTQVCGCQSTAQGVSDSPAAFRPADALAPTTLYDEQLGVTFTQSFTSMAYNVTAVEQTDPTLGTGPAYLLNGVSGTGYWYQVGLSWNWNPGSDPGTGFAMSYEVFGPQGDSLFPTNGNGGLLDFSGAVNQGDNVLLNLYFNSGAVIMQAHDYNTGASASESYTAKGASSFQGDTLGNANNNGFFTGLMTEWYHPQVYASNEKEVVYIESNFAISSAWMWMDEYGSNGNSDVFQNVTSSAVSFTSAPMKLHEFAANGATEYMDAYELITGAMNTTAPATVPLTLSYSVVGGGVGYSAPVLHYVSEGTQVNATLSTSSTIYNADIGSEWNVTSSLSASVGSNAGGERWQTDQQTNGTVTAAHVMELAYYHQYQGLISYIVDGAATSAPDFDFTAFGTPQNANTSSQPTAFWVDTGTQYGMTNPLQGSSSLERWVTEDAVNGTATSSFILMPAYEQQYLVSVRYSTIGGGNISSAGEVYFSAPSLGKEVTIAMTLGSQSLWLDAGAAYGLTQNVTLTLPFSDGGGAGFYSEAERWITNSTGGTVMEGLSIDPQYQNQYLVSLQPSPAAAGTLSVSGGWYDAGTVLQVTPASDSGWKLVTWTSATPLAAPAMNPNGSISLEVNSPVNDTAVFYPGLTITTAANVVISYSYASGAASGTISQGSMVVYVPPSGIKLSASASSFLSSFGGWSGVSSSSGPSISITLTSPASISARSTYDYLDIAIILGAVILLIAVVATLASRRTGKTVGSPAA